MYLKAVINNGLWMKSASVSSLFSLTPESRPGVHTQFKVSILEMITSVLDRWTNVHRTPRSSSVFPLLVFQIPILIEYFGLCNKIL